MKKEEKEKGMPQDALLESWIKASMDFWKSTASIWPAAFGGTPPASGSAGEEGADMSAEDPLRMFRDIWQTLFSLVSQPQAGDYHPVSSFYEGMLKASLPLWTGYLQLQKLWMEGEGKGAAEGEIEGIANLAQKITKTWSDMYEKEFGQVLKMPQLGLTRVYQERVNRTIEAFTHFQGALTELMQLLLIPMEKAYIAVREEIINLEKQGKETLKDSKASYQLWIKKMEENYMVLLRSPEYTETLGNTVKALHDFRVTRTQLSMDILQDLPIPTNKEMDELYKDLYLLKKRVKELEKKVKSYEK
jgi:class III poly(R)-hydroxyalkanoic acid synthase PhaE subunit